MYAPAMQLMASTAVAAAMPAVAAAAAAVNPPLVPLTTAAAVEQTRLSLDEDAEVCLPNIELKKG